MAAAVLPAVFMPLEPLTRDEMEHVIRTAGVPPAVAVCMIAFAFLQHESVQSWERDPANHRWIALGCRRAVEYAFSRRDRHIVA